MTAGTADVSRRGFLRAAAVGTAGAGAVGAGAAGSAAAAEDGGDGGNASEGGNADEGGDGGGGGGGAAPEPTYGGWFDDVANFDGTTDMRGQSEVAVAVGTQGNNGNFAFDPPAVHVDPGTTVVWEWTGEGGEHNVQHDGGEFESELTAEGGFTYEQTFDEDGMWKYFCRPHQSLGMKGAVVVGSDYPGAGAGGGEGGGPQQLPDTAKTLGIATTLVMAVTLGLAYFFLRYGGDYGDTAE